jgi:adenosylcobinamide-phosphate guanylyltransferase
MISVLMCGGKGTRMYDAAGVEKPLQKVKESTLIERVLHALLSSRMFEKIVAITSVNTPRTTSFIHELSYNYTEIEVMETAGHGFSWDLSAAMSCFKPSRAFIVPVDLPLLNAKTVQCIIARCPANRPCVSILLEKSFVEKLGITASVVVRSLGSTLYCHSGISVIDSSKLEAGFNLIEHYIVMNEIEIAFNVNTKRELGLSEHIIDNGGPNQGYLGPLH